jgi:acyl carrier protein
MGLDAVELVVAVEDKFGITIPNAVAAQMITPAIMISYVQETVAQNAKDLNEAPRWTQEEVRDVVRQVIREQLGIDTFRDTDEFVRDLGID